MIGLTLYFIVEEALLSCTKLVGTKGRLVITTSASLNTLSNSRIIQNIASMKMTFT